MKADRTHKRSFWRRALLAFVLLLFWPWLDTPFRYVHWWDQVRTSIPIALIFGLPCSTIMGTSIEYDRGPTCILFDPPRRFKGVWQNAFEGSYFVEGAKHASQLDEAQSLTWLDIPQDMHRKLAYRDPLVEIEFVGRKTTLPGDYGHGGLSRHEIVLDKIISYRPLPSDAER